MLETHSWSPEHFSRPLLSPWVHMGRKLLLQGGVSCPPPQSHSPGDIASSCRLIWCSSVSVALPTKAISPRGQYTKQEEPRTAGFKHGWTLYERLFQLGCENCLWEDMRKKGEGPVKTACRVPSLHCDQGKRHGHSRGTSCPGPGSSTLLLPMAQSVVIACSGIIILQIWK